MVSSNSTDKWGVTKYDYVCPICWCMHCALHSVPMECMHAVQASQWAVIGM